MDRRALAADVYKVARGAGTDNDMPQGLTPLMVASAKGHVHSMLLLIDRGAKIDAVNDLGQTALHLAALNGHAHAVKCLVAEGAESWHRDSNGCTPMDCAKSESEEHERCRLILDMAKPRGKVKVKVPDIQDVDGETPAHHYLVQNIYGLPRSCASNGISPMPSPLPYPPHALHARSCKHLRVACHSLRHAGGRWVLAASILDDINHSQVWKRPRISCNTSCEQVPIRTIRQGQVARGRAQAARSLPVS
jgi:hypothetical protein